MRKEIKNYLFEPTKTTLCNTDTPLLSLESESAGNRGENGDKYTTHSKFNLVIFSSLGGLWWFIMSTIHLAAPACRPFQTASVTVGAVAGKPAMTGGTPCSLNEICPRFAHFACCSVFVN
jgi:hypothetical protein